MPFNAKKLLIVLAVIIACIGLDQETKILAKQHLEPLRKNISYMGDSFRLTYVENDGAFMSWGSDFNETIRTWALKIFPVIMLAGLFFYTLFSKSLNLIQVLSFSFILGGGISNIYDRLTRGSVIDFMNMGFGDLRTGIFNVADMAIMLGLFMMIPFLFKKEEDQENKATEAVVEDTNSH